MIVLVSFDGIERSLFEKASNELDIAHRISYFDSVDDLLAHANKGKAAGRPVTFPRVIVMNIDAATCLNDMKTLKSVENWKKIPLIGYGFLKTPADVTTFYSHGGASCIRKPETYRDLVKTTRAAMGYWLSMSIMPCDYLQEA